MTKQITFEEVCMLVTEFSKARRWDETNSPKDLAISISLEASELLEHFQWREESIGDKQELASELADIIIYAIQFANKYDIDIPTAVQKKLEKSNKKYPVEIFQIEDGEERDKAWYNAKKNYKKDTML